MVLDRLGHHEEAVKIVDMCLGERWQNLALDLKGGLSGMGLGLLRFAATTGDTALRDAARRLAETVADRLAPPTPYRRSAEATTRGRD
ncbi:hypothetical protein [Streptomyces sp. NPDC012616]|uniref:hypothetical protein n=1 Tax=Streptomyces sp. NPDC012616 TaxID=3364840 RepID=UPI0036ECCAA0